MSISQTLFFKIKQSSTYGIEKYDALLTLTKNRHPVITLYMSFNLLGTFVLFIAYHNCHEAQFGFIYII